MKKKVFHRRVQTLFGTPETCSLLWIPSALLIICLCRRRCGWHDNKDVLLLTPVFKFQKLCFVFFQARVLATIGVTRGLGDHSLKVHDSNIYIKPFLSCCPEVGCALHCA